MAAKFISLWKQIFRLCFRFLPKVVVANGLSSNSTTTIFGGTSGGDVSRRHTQRESRGFPEKGGTRFKYEVKMQPQNQEMRVEVQLFLGVLGGPRHFI